MSSTEMGRRRQQALFNFLGAYPLATTDQLAALIWAGDHHLARTHLLAYVRAGRLRRTPHPLFRNGSYVYTRSDRATNYGQKVLHHLAEVDFHVSVARSLGRYGARVVPEMPWGPGLIPDQTVLWRDSVWAVEHHLTGQFNHVPGYQRFMEEEAYTLCHWWREEIRVALLVVTTPVLLERVRGVLQRNGLTGLHWRVVTQEAVLRDPGAWLRFDERGRHG